MRLVWEKSKDGNRYDITDFVTSVTWDGSVGQASRHMSVSILYSVMDKNIRDINIRNGDRLLLYEDDQLLIDAMVYTRERKSEQGSITYECYDDIKRLLKDKGTYSFKKTTPEKIAYRIAKDAGILIGNIVSTNVPISKMLCDEDEFYKIIMKAYTKAYQSNGKKYMPIMIGKKIHIIEKGEIIDEYVLNDKRNITSSNYSESIENMTNVVKIYDEKGKLLGEVKDDKQIALYGIFQDAYTKEEGVNQTTAAKKLLNGVEKEANFESLEGNCKCIAGYGIKVKDSLTGLTGKFWIDSDSHTFENGIHKMSLSLTFKNLMDIEDDEEKQQKKKKKSKKKSIAKTNDKSEVYITKASSRFHSSMGCSGMTYANVVKKKEAIEKGKIQCAKCWR